MIQLNMIWNKLPKSYSYALAKDSRIISQSILLPPWKVRDPLLCIHMSTWLDSLTPIMPWTFSMECLWHDQRSRTQPLDIYDASGQRTTLHIATYEFLHDMYVQTLSWSLFSVLNYLLSSYVFVSVSNTKWLETSHTHAWVNITHTNLNGLSMPNWQSYG